MSWVQQYISAFGGDPTRVIMLVAQWRPSHRHNELTSFCFSSGESAGAMSVGFHLLANNGEPDGLFRGAFMVYFPPDYATLY